MGAIFNGIGIRVVFGVQPIKPIRGAPEGRQKLRMRNTAAAELFVKNGTAIYRFVLVDKGDYWFCDPRLEQSRNQWVKRELLKHKEAA
jgi:hypothetical protein